MPYPMFSARHVNDNVTSSRSINQDARCVFNIKPDKLYSLQRTSAPLIFDMEIDGKRNIYYAHADDLELALEYYKLISSQNDTMYVIGVDPDTGHVHRTDYSVCDCHKQQVLFTLLPMTPELYVRQYIKISGPTGDDFMRSGERETKQLIERCSDRSAELFRVLSENTSTPELKLLPYLRLLKKAGADVLTRHGKKQRTMLHEAAAHSHPLILQWLLEEGADIEARDADGMTPLCCAVEKAKHENVTCLLESDANPDAMDNSQRSIIQLTLSPDYQTMAKRVSMVDLLMQRETTIASGKCNMFTSLDIFFNQGEFSYELFNLLNAYCLPLRDLIKLSQNWKSSNPEAASMLKLNLQAWMYSRAKLYQRIWKEKKGDILSAMLEGDAVGMKNGQIVKDDERIKRFLYSDRLKLIDALRHDIDLLRTDESMLNIMAPYYYANANK